MYFGKGIHQIIGTGSLRDCPKGVETTGVLGGWFRGIKKALGIIECKGS